MATRSMTHLNQICLESLPACQLMMLLWQIGTWDFTFLWYVEYISCIICFPQRDFDHFIGFFAPQWTMDCEGATCEFRIGLLLRIVI